MQSDKKISLEWNDRKDGGEYAKNGLFTYIIVPDHDCDVEDRICEMPKGTRMLYHDTREFGPNWSFAEEANGNYGDLEETKRPNIYFTMKTRIYNHWVLWVVPMATIKDEWDGDKERATAYFNAVTNEINQIIDGDVWGIKVCFAGEEIDACWGYVGLEYAKEAVQTEYANYEYKEEIEKILTKKQGELNTITEYLNSLKDE